MLRHLTWWGAERMSGPTPPVIALGEAERSELERLIRARTTEQQVALRARIILAVGRGLNNTQAAGALGIAAKTVRQWRGRWRRFSAVSMAELGVAARLADAPRPGAPTRISAEQVCQIMALACEQPADSDRPVSQWSARELADEIVRRGIIDRISPRHAGRLLKSGRPQTASDSLLVDARG
jgi:putative transposase